MQYLREGLARLRPGFLGVMVVLALLLTACAEPLGNNNTRTLPTVAAENGDLSPDPGADEVEILMQDDTFTPEQVTVPAGTTVVWVNAGDRVHTVTAANGSLFDEEVAPGESFVYTFDQPGTYAYYCALHAGMVGEIIVE